MEFRPHAVEMIDTIGPVSSRAPVAEHASESYANEAAIAVEQQRTRQVRAAQVRLLYSNANTGGAVTIITAPVLSYFQWDVIEHPVVVGWLLYILVLSAARFVLTRRYWRASPADTEVNRWGTAFAVGAALAGAGVGCSRHPSLPGSPPDESGAARLRRGRHDARRCLGTGAQA